MCSEGKGNKHAYTYTSRYMTCIPYTDIHEYAGAWREILVSGCTYIHTYIQTYTYDVHDKYIHVYIHTNTYIHTYSSSRACGDIQTAGVQTDRQTDGQVPSSAVQGIHIHVHTHAYIPCMRVCTYIYAYHTYFTYIHTYIGEAAVRELTYIHMYIRVNIYIHTHSTITYRSQFNWKVHMDASRKSDILYTYIHMCT